MKRKYFQPYWEILRASPHHIPSFNPSEPRRESCRHLGQQQFPLVKTWWKRWEFHQFYSSEKCTQMRHYVPRSTADIQTKECVKLYSGSWKYPDLWKTQNRKPELPLETMREIVKTWIFTHARAHRENPAQRGNVTDGMRTMGFEESLVIGGGQIPADAHCQTSRLCRRLWPNESRRGLAGESPLGDGGHMSALNSRDQEFFFTSFKK